MVKSLGLQTMTEGVATIEQLEYFKGQGCDEVQEYYEGKSILAEELESFSVKKIKNIFTLAFKPYIL